MAVGRGPGPAMKKYYFAVDRRSSAIRRAGLMILLRAGRDGQPPGLTR